jgi:putative ABC transport system ATP-binding protein
VGAEGRRGEEYAVVGRDGSVHLPPDVLDRLPPGSLMRVVPDEDGSARMVPVTSTDDTERSGAMSKTIVVNRVTVGYGKGDPVLRDVTAVVTPGRLLAVTGPSGAGKTTLLWTMAGLLRPRTGSVTVDNEPIRDRDHAVAAKIVLVPQDNGLAAILTAAENVQVALIAGGVAPPEARRRTAESLDRLGLSGQADQLVEELSGGQQQRTAIARGMALHGDVVLADEVTSELDAANRQRVLDLLREEADRGAAVVFATHDPEAAAAGDAELHLLDGRAELVRGGATTAR